MRGAITQLAVVIVLFVTVALARAQTQPQAPLPRSRYSPTAAAQERGQAQRQPDTWYDFLLRQFNPNNLDYGTWMEQRRRAFLQASVKNPYFLYSFWMTMWSLFVMTAYAKLWIDRRRERFVTEEIMTDLYNHDLYSREAAKEAIEKHNQHIERCNRVIEAAESGRSVPGTSSEIGEMRQRLQQLGAELATTVAERDKAKEQLEHKSALIAEMSLRIDGLAKKGNGNATQQVDVHGSSQDLVAHINRLQQELYAERRKNQRLKGA